MHMYIYTPYINVWQIICFARSQGQPIKGPKWEPQGREPPEYSRSIVRKICIHIYIYVYIYIICTHLGPYVPLKFLPYLWGFIPGDSHCSPFSPGRSTRLPFVLGFLDDWAVLPLQEDRALEELLVGSN